MEAKKPGRSVVTSMSMVAAVAIMVTMVFLLIPSQPASTQVSELVSAGQAVEQPRGLETIRPGQLGSEPLANAQLAPESPPEASPQQSQAEVARRLAPPSGILRFVYFVEADAAPRPNAVRLIGEQADALQLYWYQQFGGTFALASEPVIIVYGDHPALWYDQTPNGEDPRWHRLLNIQQEVRTKLGLTDASNERTVVYPAARLDGRVGAIRYTGAWLDADDVECIDGSADTVPYAADYPANCLMTVAHELGHVYGLGHQGDDLYCMQYGFYRYISGTKNCDFSSLSRQLVVGDNRNQGWLDAKPGDRR